MRKKNKGVFSEAEAELARTEAEINQQTNEILEFLRVHSQQHSSSPEIRALQELYDLFNTQVSENLKLRKALEEYKDCRKEICETKRKNARSIQSFVQRLEQASGRTIPDFATAIDFIEADLKRLSIADRCEQELVSVNSQRNLMRRHVQFAKEKNEAIKRKIADVTAEYSMMLAELNAKTENSCLNAARLRMQIDEQEKKKQELEHEMEVVESGARVYKCRIGAQESAVKQKVDAFREVNKKRCEKLEALEADLAQWTARHAQTGASRNGVVAAFERAKGELALIEKNAEAEMADLVKEMQEHQKQLKDANDELEKVTERKHQLMAEHELWSQKKIQQKRARAEISAEIAAMKARLKALAKREKEATEEIQQSQGVFIRYSCGHATFDDFISDVQRTNEEITVQIKRLESQIRVQKLDAKRVSEENQKMRTVLSSLTEAC